LSKGIRTINLGLDHYESEQLTEIMRQMGLKTATELMRLLLAEKAKELGIVSRTVPRV